MTSENALTRRSLLGGAGAAAALSLLPSHARSQQNGWYYDFNIHALGSRAGHHRVAFARDGDLLNVDIDIRLKIKVPLFGTFGYTQQVQEVWRGDQLVRLRAETDDGKKHDIVTAELTPNGKLATNSTRLGLKMLPGHLWPASSIWKASSANHQGFLDLTRGNVRPTEISYIGKETIQVLGRSRSAQRYAVKSRRVLEVLYGLDGEWLGLEWSEFGFSAHYERVA
ncbi:DUF6134 family protein [Minwuia sp.]|uniref:DUF6134 family protein n=1 Tax=Minwuia sp. TaxID=2493630 RepID=UPI003A9374F3